MKYSCCHHQNLLHFRFELADQLINVAFDEENNTSLRLAASVKLAESLGVEEKFILRSIDDIDKFMME